jgi:cell division protein FtsB
LSETHRFRTLVASALTLVLLLIGVAALKSYRDFEAARHQEERLKQRIQEERAAIARLELRVERLEKDPATLERLAREVLWMARPDEVVIVLPPDPMRSQPAS